MSKQKNYEVIRENKLGYLKMGDYFVPDLKLPQENRSIGKYGRMHRDYLQEHNPIRFDDLVLEGKLWTYLADLNEQAQDRLQLIIMQMQEAESVNDELKEDNQIAWVQAMNSIHNRAKEIVLHELVYEEDV
ncbi:MAG: TnpV protein [Eubacterium sp.]|nr:TnpV protein [Eubacterium sp.]